MGHPLNKSEVIMGEGPIRTTGEHEVLIQLHADVETTISVNISAE
jgi:large subunit ribosomal protein L9